MLSEDEENKLELFLRIIEASKEQLKFPQLGSYDIEWLANKLKEINDEAAQYFSELYKANEELARVYEHYEG